MKLIVLRNNLKEGLVAIKGSTGSKSSNLPILKNVLITATKSKILLSATDLEIGSTYQISGKVIQEGKASVLLDNLLDIVANLTSPKLNLESKSDSLIIKSDNYQARLVSSDPDEFPIIPEISNKDRFIEINTDILKKMLLEITPAISYSEIRPEISGMLFNFSLNNLTIAGTDSFRLAEKCVYSRSFNTNFEHSFRVIIPLKLIKELLRVLPPGQQAQILFDSNQVMFKFLNQQIISRLIEGEFPEYKTKIPKKFNTEIVVSKSELLEALKLASIFAQQNQQIKLKLGQNYLKVSSASASLGENYYLVPAKVSGKLGEIIFNLNYFLDGLKCIEEKKVFLGLNQEDQPALIKGLEDNSFIYILMPIKY